MLIILCLGPYALPFGIYKPKLPFDPNSSAKIWEVVSLEELIKFKDFK